MIEKEDKAGEKYWSEMWKSMPMPSPIHVSSLSPNNYLVRQIHHYFANLFSNLNVKGKSILEIGCGNSVWLPYFSSQFGMEVSGLDYSEIGCAQSRQILSRENVEGEIFCSDFFSPPPQLLGAFDFVISMGVAEHFTDTAKVLGIFSKFLKPGGIIITEIPNLTGALGYLQKKLNKPVYDIHMLIDKKQLIKAHEKAGLQVFDSRYLASISFHVNVEGKETKIPNYRLKKWFVYLLSCLAKIIWIFETFFFSLPVSKFLSPVILVAAKK